MSGFDPGRFDYTANIYGPLIRRAAEYDAERAEQQQQFEAIAEQRATAEQARLVQDAAERAEMQRERDEARQQRDEERTAREAAAVQAKKDRRWNRSVAAASLAVGLCGVLWGVFKPAPDPVVVQQPGQPSVVAPAPR